MTRRNPSAVLLSIIFLFLTFALGAATHRAVLPPGQGGGSTDVLGIGPMSGAAVSGSVASVQGTIITLNSGAAPAIQIDASAAKFMGDTGAGSISDVKPGMRVTAFIANTTIVPLTPLPALHAQLITIESFPDLAVTGSLQAIDLPSKFTVLGISMTVDPNTSFSSAFPTFAPIKGLSDLALGQVVHVTAAFAGMNILAKRVQILAPVVIAPVIISGTVKAISAPTWIITGKDGTDITVIVDAQTKVIGDPKAGDSVQVMANLDASHNYLAIAIMKLGMTVPPPTNIELHGFVKSITATQWTIGGPPGSMAPDFLVKITLTTVIYANPAVGDRVIVVGTHDSTGALVALKIGKEG